MNPIHQIIEIAMWFIAIVIIFAVIIFEFVVYNYIKERWRF